MTVKPLFASNTPISMLSYLWTLFWTFYFFGMSQSNLNDIDQTREKTGSRQWIYGAQRTQGKLQYLHALRFINISELKYALRPSETLSRHLNSNSCAHLAVQLTPLSLNEIQWKAKAFRYIVQTPMPRRCKINFQLLNLPDNWVMWLQHTYIPSLEAISLVMSSYRHITPHNPSLFRQVSEASKIWSGIHSRGYLRCATCLRFGNYFRYLQ